MFVRTISRMASRVGVAILFCTLSAGSAAQASSTIQITAVPSTFSPDKVVMHVGQTTTLEFNHTEGIHGIASTDLGIPETVIAPDKTTTIDVTTAKTGTYVLHCQIVCGEKHADMALTVIVES